MSLVTERCSICGALVEPGDAAAAHAQWHSRLRFAVNALQDQTELTPGATVRNDYLGDVAEL